MSKSKKAAKSVALIMIFSFGSKILGFMREQLIAAKFGSDARTDTFFIAMSAISLFTLLLTTSINNTMIPILSEIEIKEGKEGKREHTNNLLNIVMLVSVILIIVAWFLAPLLMKVLAFGFGQDQFNLAVLLMRIGLPTIAFASMVGVFRGYLQSELAFLESAITGFPFNFVYIFFLVFLSGIFGIKGLMVASVIAVLSQVTIQLPDLKKTGYSYKYILDFKDIYVRKIIYFLPPVLVSVGINDVNNIIDKALGSRLVEGSISALNYAARVNNLTTGIFVTAVTTVIYPILSQEANKENKDGLKRVIIQGINVILLITIPATVGMILLANPIVKVAFQRGEFDAVATYMTAGALVYYSLGLIGIAFNSFLTRVYYSLQDTRTPMLNSFVMVFINVVFNLILIKFMAHRGLALATSISVIVTSLYLLYGLKKKIGSFGFMQSVQCGLKALGAAIIMGIVVYFLDRLLTAHMGTSSMGELLALVVSAGTGALVYSLLIYLFKIKEVEWAIGMVKTRLGK